MRPVRISRQRSDVTQTSATDGERQGVRDIPGRHEFRFWSALKVRNCDTDQFRHVNNAAIATYFETSRMEIFVDEAPRRLMEDANLAVVNLSIDFHAELFYPAEVSVGSIVANVGRTSMWFRQAVFHVRECIASAEATCVLFDPRKRRPQAISEALRIYLLQTNA